MTPIATIATNRWRIRRNDNSTTAIAMRSTTIPVFVANQFNAFAIGRYGSGWKRANQPSSPYGGFEPNAASITNPSRITTTSAATIRGHHEAFGRGGGGPGGPRPPQALGGGGGAAGGPPTPPPPAALDRLARRPRRSVRCRAPHGAMVSH